MDSALPSARIAVTVSLLDAELASPGREAAAHFAAAQTMPAPSTIGRYAIGRRLGAGGMGEVFEAHDPVLRRTLAVKLVHGDLSDPTRAAAVRLLREAQTLARVNHPNVVQIYEVGVHDGRVFLAMEVIAGATLRVWSSTAQPLAARLDVLLQAGRGLHAVHKIGLVHRDVKPDNVIVGKDGRVRVVDFGLSRAAGPPTDPPHPDGELPTSLQSPEMVLPSRLTASGAMVGTPVYMAPEQLRRPVIDAHCDQFAFCVMAWEVLAGKRPFPSGSLSVLIESHTRGPSAPPQGTDVPAGVWQALARGLAHDPAARWPDLDALVDALQRSFRRPSPWPRRLGTAALGATVLAIPLAFAYADDDTCRGLGAAGPTARTELARAEALRGAVADAAVDTLVARQHAIAEQRTAACVGSPGVDALAERRTTACLERAQQRLSTLIDALASDGATARVVTAIDSEHGEDCRASASSPSLPPDPIDPLRADRVASVRATLDVAMTELALGRAARVAAQTRELLALAEAAEHAPLVAEVTRFQGELAIELGEPEQARDRLIESAHMADAVGHDALAADAWASLSRVAIAELVDPGAARLYLRQAEAALARLGPDPRRERVLQVRRGQLAALEGDLATARAELTPLVAALPSDAIAPRDWPILGVAADIEESAGDLDRAFELHERLRRAMVRRTGERSSALASVDYNLGKLDLRRDRAAPALAALLRAQDGWIRGFGPDHLDLALVHTALQQWEMQYGSLAPAREHAERALALRMRAVPHDHPDVGLGYLGVGAVATMQGDFAGAIEAYVAALSIHEQALGAEHPETALVRLNLAEAKVEEGQGTAALRDVEGALAVLEGAGDLDPALMAFAHRVHAGALRASGADAAALVALGRAEALGAAVTDPPEAALRAVERVRLARRAPGELAWATAVDTARARVAAVTGDGATLLASRLDALTSDPPPQVP